MEGKEAWEGRSHEGGKRGRHGVGGGTVRGLLKERHDQGRAAMTGGGMGWEEARR